MKKNYIFTLKVLYDLTTNKTLNISSSYIIPYINNFPSEHNINFIIPKLEEIIYINIIINIMALLIIKLFFQYLKYIKTKIKYIMIKKI